MAEQKAETSELLTIRLPVWWTFGGLVAGLFAGLALAGTATLEPVLAVTEPAGTLWLRALQMTIIPLVASLLVIGIAQMVRAARAGRAARRMLGWVFAVLVFSGLVSAVFMPLLLASSRSPRRQAPCWRPGAWRRSRCPNWANSSPR